MHARVLTWRQLALLMNMHNLSPIALFDGSILPASADYYP